MKTVLITGATSGIGKACADLFVKNDFRLVLCGRRHERLMEFKESHKNQQIEILHFDVRNQEEVEERINSLREPFNQIDILINNAGNAHGLDPIHTGSIEDWDAMIDINVKGLLYVTKAVLPSMTAQKSGHIINIGSIAGKEAYPNGNVYCASKAAVDALTKGMRLDLNSFGIKVSEVNPGAVNTEFSNVRFKGDQQRADRVYDGFQPLVAEDIAEIVFFIATRPVHVNIADLLVLPTAQASSTMIHRQ